MTQQQATRFLAEKAMGWETKQTSEGNFIAVLRQDGYETMVYLGQFTWPGKSWSPFTDANHALEVLEAMLAKRWHAVMLCPANGRHYCDFYRGPMTNRDDAPYGHESLSAAICLAAVFALGGEVGDA